MPSIWDRLKKAFGGSVPKSDIEDDVYFLDQEDRDKEMYSELEDEQDKRDKLDIFMDKFVPEDPDAVPDEQKEANSSLGRQLHERAYEISSKFHNSSDMKDEFQEKFQKEFQEIGLAVTRRQRTGRSKAAKDAITGSVSYMQMASCEIARQIYDDEAINSEKEQVQFLKKASFYIDTGMFDAEFYDNNSKVRDFYDDNEIHAYIDNIRTLREEGNLSKALKKMEVEGDLSKAGKEIKQELSQMQYNFRYNLMTNPSGLTKNGVLPMFREKDLQDVGKLCDNYLMDNGYQNTPENKAIRNVKKAVDRATLFRFSHSPKGLKKGDEDKRLMMFDRLGTLGERLDVVSTGSKSKQFTELCDALKAMKQKSSLQWTDADRERLMDAARDYIDAKKDGFFSGGSTRRTDKGQIRFDIAEEILNLCEGDLMKPSKSKAERTAERKAHEQEKVVVREKIPGGYNKLAQDAKKNKVKYTPSKEIYTPEDAKNDKEVIKAYFDARRVDIAKTRENKSIENKQQKPPVMQGQAKGK